MPSLEFLLHYRCPTCQHGWNTADRLPLRYSTCPACGVLVTSRQLTTHLGALNTDLEEFADLLERVAAGLRDGSEITHLEQA